MKISLKDQAEISPALPMQCAATFTGSALPLEFVDIPGEIGGAAVVAVAVTVTNADGVAATAPCEHAGGVWRVAFAASCFEHYGFVERGASVALTLRDGSGNERGMVLAVGDLEVKRSSPSAAPGDPEKSYQIKGEDIFVKTRVIDDVQHYARQEMSYDAEMGAWGADWLGDYILEDGEFIPYEAPTGGGVTTAAVALLMLLAPFFASAVTATKGYVDRKDGEVAAAATNYTDSAISQIPAPDFSPSNATLVATIEETSPAPGDYATVSNKAMTALQSYTETDPTIPGWAKAPSKPTYTAAEVGALGIHGEQTITGTGSQEITFTFGSAVPYFKLTDSYGNTTYIEADDSSVLRSPIWLKLPAVDGTFALKSEIPSAFSYTVITNAPWLTSFTETDPTVPRWAKFETQPLPPDYSNVSNKAMNALQSYTETDPTIPGWAKAASKPTYTAAEVGATTPADVTAAIREQSLGGIWDAELEVWWTPRMKNGSLTYEATTNVNLNAGN